MDDTRPPENDLRSQVDDLRRRLEEAEDVIRAIRAGGVDALVVYEGSEPSVFTLQGADHAYRVILDEMTEGAVTLDRDGTILYCNPRFAEMCGVPRTALLGTSLDACLDAARLQALTCISACEDEQTIRLEALLCPNEGEAIPVLLSMARLSAYDAEAFCLLVTDLTERKEYERQLLGHQRRLTAMASELMLVEDAERKRIATVLHDEIGSSLAYVKMRLADLASTEEREEMARSLGELTAMLGDVIGYTRSLTFELSPPVLHELGLEAALEWVAERLQEQHGLEVCVETDGEPKPLSDDLRVTLYRAVRELLTNVVRHAEATEVRLSSSCEDGRMVLVIADNGVGFDPSLAGPGHRTGFGLFNIAERLSHLGGTMEIESTPGGGTRITLLAPLSS